MSYEGQIIKDTRCRTLTELTTMTQKSKIERWSQIFARLRVKTHTHTHTQCIAGNLNEFTYTFDWPSYVYVNPRCFCIKS